ncbi:hypothetical protein [Ensifer canadensis]
MLEQTLSQSRRAFLGQTGKLTTACAVVGLSGGLAQDVSANTAESVAEIGTNMLKDRHYLLADVRLEEGFEYDGDTVIGTRTALYIVEIKDGKIAALHPANATLPSGVARYQAHGQLMLPAMRDMHIHLDKTFYGGPWQAPRPRQGKTIMDMIALEEKLIPQLLPTSQQRAEGLIGLLQSRGEHRRTEPLQHRSGQWPEKP